LRAAAPALLSVLVATGCGPTSSTAKFSGESKSVAQVVSDLQSDGERRKPDDICNKLLAKGLQERISAAGTSCGAEMKKAIEDADTFKLDVQKVKVTGTTATAIVKGTNRGKDVIRTFELVKEGGAWKLSSFGSG